MSRFKSKDEYPVAPLPVVTSTGEEQETQEQAELRPLEVKPYQECEELTDLEIAEREQAKLDILADLNSSTLRGGRALRDEHLDSAVEIAASQVVAPVVEESSVRMFASVPDEQAAWNRKWWALISVVSSVDTPSRLLKSVLASHLAEVREPDPIASEPYARVDQIQAAMEALTKRYGVVVGMIKVWSDDLHKHLDVCGAHIYQLPLRAAVDGVLSAMSRGHNKLRNRPQAPELDGNDVGSLEARVRYINELPDYVRAVEGLPEAFGSSLVNLDKVLDRFIALRKRAQENGDRSNVSGFQRQPPDRGLSPANELTYQRPARREDPYQKLFS